MRRRLRRRGGIEDTREAERELVKESASDLGLVSAVEAQNDEALIRVLVM